MIDKRPLRLAFFLYDVLRFAALFWVLSPGAVGENGDMAIRFALAFAAPQTLFIFLAFFLWWEPDNHPGFAPLYASGKFISGTALSAQLIFGLANDGSNITINDAADLRLIAMVAGLAATDLLSAIAAMLSLARAVKRENPTPRPETHVNIDTIADDRGGQ